MGVGVSSVVEEGPADDASVDEGGGTTWYSPLDESSILDPTG